MTGDRPANDPGPPASRTASRISLISSSRSVRLAMPVRVLAGAEQPDPRRRADQVVEHPDKDNANCSR